MSEDFPFCPKCRTKTVAELIYPYDGQLHTSYYCPKCEKDGDPWQPKPLGNWTRWNPKPGDYKENESQIGKTVEQLKDDRVA
jgi:hypothetical protein